jgi:hypothetical protein
MPDYPTEFILIGSHCWVTRSAACLHAQAARAQKYGNHIAHDVQGNTTLNFQPTPP